MRRRSLYIAGRTRSLGAALVRAASVGILVIVALASASPRGSAETSASRSPSDEEFQAYVASLRPQAEAMGIAPATFDAAFAGLNPDPSVAAMTRQQPELLKPVGSYLAAQVTPERVKAGRVLMNRWRDQLAEIQRRYGVPPAIVVAVWGLETNYGAAPGNKDVIRSMATLGAMGYRPDLYRAELLAALELIQAGAVSRPSLRGSWAGAMGQPQFMASSFERYAADGDHDGRRDIWTDIPDSLASIANYLSSQGWRPGLPWGFEIRLPRGVDLSEDHGTFSEWAARGVLTSEGKPPTGADAAVLYFPSGSAGPAFLVTSNFEVIKTYNFSDSYVLGVGLLAGRMEGRPAISAAWPIDPPISRDDRIALQARLADLGYPVDNREGRISLALRDTIRSAQIKVGMIPDGNPTSALLVALRAAH